MPSKNTVREYDAPAYYHVYNRGANKEPIFYDDQDREKFLALLARHIDPDNPEVRGDGRPYEVFEVELIAYCLMENHFHLLIYQEVDPEAISLLMKSVATAYTMYFNKKYQRTGHLFQGVFKASRITDDSYLLHITRYIHMNPRSYIRYKWSSMRYYLGKEAPSWLSPDRVNNMSPRQYRNFVESYQSQRQAKQLIQDQLADR